MVVPTPVPAKAAVIAAVARPHPAPASIVNPAITKGCFRILGGYNVSEHLIGCVGNKVSPLGQCGYFVEQCIHEVVHIESPWGYFVKGRAIIDTWLIDRQYKKVITRFAPDPQAAAQLLASKSHFGPNMPAAAILLSRSTRQKNGVPAAL